MEPITISRPSSLSLRDYPHVFMPPKATPVNRVGFINAIAPGATAGLQANQANQILIPNLQEGWISQLAVALGTYGSGQTWTILQSGQGMRDYTNIPAPLGAVETPVVRAIALLPNQPLVLTFHNGGATPLSVHWSMYGWYYPARR